MLRNALFVVAACLPLTALASQAEPVIHSQDEAVAVYGIAVPPALMTKGEHPVCMVRADGKQIYTAEKSGDQWVWSKGSEPVAVLWDFLTAAEVGTHSKGPTWVDSDGSKVAKDIAAKDAVVSAPSPNKSAIPWLLVSVKGEGTGRFSKVTHVQRLDTWGGMAPKDPPAKEGQRMEVHYQATYVFLVPD